MIHNLWVITYESYHDDKLISKSILVLEFHQLLYAIVDADLTAFNFESLINNSFQSVDQYQELKFVSIPKFKNLTVASYLVIFVQEWISLKLLLKLLRKLNMALRLNRVFSRMERFYRMERK